MATLAPDGVDIALDTAASGSLPDLIAIVGDPARVSTVADHANAHRLGVHLADAENDSTLLAEAGGLGRQGRYTPRIERTYPIERIAEAHAHAERGHTRGKIVVRV
nr:MULTISPECIES: zinc-binding dehydrogenase [unclassified Nonomuraea]